MKKVAIALLSGLLVFAMISCGSKETPEEEKPEAPVIETPVEETEPTPDPIEEVVEDTVVQVDNTLVMKTVTLARDKAIESGAADKEPALLKAIDDLYAAVEEKAKTGADVSKECADIAKRYEALSLYIGAKEAKAAIDDTKMFSLAQSLYDEGCKNLEKTEALFADPNAIGQQLFDTATNASVPLNSVLIVVYKQIAKDTRVDAKTAKNKADSVKAAVSQKEKYTEAVEAFKKGDSLYSMHSHKKATESYKASEEIFMTLFNDISEKRAAVLKAIEEAKKKVEESEEYAALADAESPLTEKIAGIEDEDAVLLEADNYSNPDDAAVAVPDELQEASLEKQIEGTVNNFLREMGAK